ncbi:hypothetical protein [Thermoflavimicrobium dichotomicum]|uniref:Lipid II:glycine glycyltransferase n=1 Tax=Thermoflavimicrobium dichotomicum TaxID=46223 RepID=A0A1I3NBH0_9BACL|nr:hypothetical protein [Thermoflavimicrobium dichotomicum]SFJ06495.1 hypothetical protein SAMN05421852_10471 [Thermoflavimicrobium dichotomicum]
MEIVQWKKAFLQITDVYGLSDETIEIPKSDIVIHSQLPRPILEGKRFTLHKRFKTMHIHLKKDEESLFSDLSRSTRYNINRARREQLKFEINNTPTEKEIDEFSEFYNSFARKKNIERCNTNKLRSLNEKGLLSLSYVTDQHNRILCSHACSPHGERVSMLYSCSIRLSVDPSQKNMVSRANRFLHWMEILHFKEKGYSIYDFCGLSLENDDPQLQSIDQFKKRFGGTEVMEYKCYEAKSLLGKMVLYYLYQKWKARPELMEVIL